MIFYEKYDRHVATNEVEHGIQKLCKLWSCKQKLSLKRKVMKHKVADAYKCIKKAETVINDEDIFPLLSKTPMNIAH